MMRYFLFLLLSLSFLVGKGQESKSAKAFSKDSLSLSSPRSFAFARRSPLRWGNSYWFNPMGYGVLHEGFNAQVSLSGTMAFGKHAPKGVGFGKDLSLSYLHRFSPHWSAAVGAYGSHFSWNGFQSTDIGVTAMLAYQATDRLTLYAYGTKTLTPERPHIPSYWLYEYSTPLSGDRLGVAAGYKINEKFHIQVNVEWQRAELPFFYNGVMQSGLQPIPPLYR